MTEQNNLLPCIDDLFEIRDGILCRMPQQCIDGFDQKCKEYYTNIYNVNGFHVCPYGLSSYVDKGESDNVIYTGLFTDKTVIFDKKRFKHLIKPNRFTRDQIKYLIDIEKGKKELIKENDKFQRNNVMFMHDFNKINGMIKNYSSSMAELTEGKEELTQNDVMMIHDLALTISNISQLLEYKLAMFDHEKYLDYSVSERKTVPIYKKIHKFIRIFNNFSRVNHISEKFNSIRGSCNHKIYIDEKMFELLIFLIMDNANQHSNSDSKVDIEIINNNGVPEYKISNKIKYREDALENCDDYFCYGTKSVESSKGSGIGLYLARTICNKYNIGIKVSKEDCDTQTDGLLIDKKFVLSLKFNDAFLS